MRTPVSIITGFLGSGKTSLLQRVLRSPGMRDTAVLVNELGEIALDHELIERIDTDTVVLSGGCLCCAVRDDLRQSIRTLYARRESGELQAFSRLLVETTGLANPAPIVATFFSDPVLYRTFRLAHIVTTFDAVHGANQLSRYSESMQQLAAADRIVITKTDLIAGEKLPAAKMIVRRINPLAELYDARAPGLLPSELVVSESAPDIVAFQNRRWHELSPPKTEGHTHDHAAGVKAISIATDEILDWSAVGLWLTMLLQCHGGRVLRIKALLNVIGAKGPVVIQSVQSTVHAPVHLPAWPSLERRSRIVIIADDLDAAQLRRSFEVFCGLERQPLESLVATA